MNILTTFVSFPMNLNAALTLDYSHIMDNESSSAFSKFCWEG